MMGSLPFDVAILWEVVKWFYVLGLLIYVVFASVMVKQVRQMVKTVDGDFANPLKLAAYIHFGIAVAVLFLGIIVL